MIVLIEASVAGKYQGRVGRTIAGPDTNAILESLGRLRTPLKAGCPQCSHCQQIRDGNLYIESVMGEFRRRMPTKEGRFDFIVKDPSGDIEGNVEWTLIYIYDRPTGIVFESTLP